MSADVKSLFEDAKHRMDQSIEAMRREFMHLRAGRAQPALVDNVMVEAYGSEMPLNQMATISAPDAQTLLISPFDKSQTGGIEKAILKSDLGLQPSSDGSLIRISIPPLTEERRKDLLKVVGKVGEEARVALRNIRRDINDALKKLNKDKELSDDEMHHHLAEVDKLIEKEMESLEAAIKVKEKEITEF